MYGDKMGKEILAIPEEHLEETILVIRTGLLHSDVKKEVYERLMDWCKSMKEHLEALKKDTDD